MFFIQECLCFLLGIVCKKLPSPKELTLERAEHLLCSQAEGFEDLPLETQKLKDVFVKCDSSSDVPTIVFISKMFPVTRSNLPQNKQRPLTGEELAERREIARQRHEARLKESEPEKIEMEPSEAKEEPKEEEKMEDDVFVAFARVFSGNLREGQDLYVLGPKHDPSVALKEVKYHKM